MKCSAGPVLHLRAYRCDAGDKGLVFVETVMHFDEYRWRQQSTGIDTVRHASRQVKKRCITVADFYVLVPATFQPATYNSYKNNELQKRYIFALNFYSSWTPVSQFYRLGDFGHFLRRRSKTLHQLLSIWQSEEYSAGLIRSDKFHLCRAAFGKVWPKNLKSWFLQTSSSRMGECLNRYTWYLH